MAAWDVMMLAAAMAQAAGGVVARPMAAPMAQAPCTTPASLPATSSPTHTLFQTAFPKAAIPTSRVHLFSQPIRLSVSLSDTCAKALRLRKAYPAILVPVCPIEVAQASEAVEGRSGLLTASPSGCPLIFIRRNCAVRYKRSGPSCGPDVAEVWWRAERGRVFADVHLS